jgi:hypothetical protein
MRSAGLFIFCDVRRAASRGARESARTGDFPRDPSRALVQGKSDALRRQNKIRLRVEWQCLSAVKPVEPAPFAYAKLPVAPRPRASITAGSSQTPSCAASPERRPLTQRRRNHQSRLGRVSLSARTRPKPGRWTDVHRCEIAWWPCRGVQRHWRRPLFLGAPARAVDRMPDMREHRALRRSDCKLLRTHDERIRFCGDQARGFRWLALRSAR